MSESYFLPKTVNDYFVEITGVSHPSCLENPIREWLVEKVDAIRAKFRDNRKTVQIIFYKPGEPQTPCRDQTGPGDKERAGDRVIVLRRKGAGLHVGKAPVILQAHMDMVCVPDNDIAPLQLEIEKEVNSQWLTAKSVDGRPSTLGADDGIGVATILGVLEDEALSDYPIECLFTVQEEVDMGGARYVDPKLLTGTKYVNLDNEDLTMIIYGSAGGGETRLDGEVSYMEISGYAAFKISIEGLRSGHSGVDINKGRLNAIKALSDILHRLNNRLRSFEPGNGINSYGLLLNHITREDAVRANSIPAAASALVCVKKERAADFKEDVRKLFEILKTENQPVEKEFTAQINEADPLSRAMTESSTDSLILLLNRLPHGGFKMIPSTPLLVETSSNLYNVAVDNTKVRIQSSNRSSNTATLTCLKDIQKNLGRALGYTVTRDIDAYPTWEPNEASSLLKLAKAVYQEQYGKDGYEATVVHAGLECGWIVEKKEGKIDCISIGPTIQNPHTKDERLEILDREGAPTVQQFYDAVVKIVTRIFQD